MEFGVQQLQSFFSSNGARSWSMPEFLATYTLHDSSLMGWSTIRAPFCSTFLAVDWDLVWNSAIPRAFRRLLIRIPVVYRVDWSEGSWWDTTIANAQSAMLTADARTKLLEDGRNDLRAYQSDDAGVGAIKHPAMDDAVTRTAITGVNWSKLELLHAATVEFVAMSDEGELFPIVTNTSATT